MDIPQHENEPPSVTLAGKPWPVPLLAAKQNKIIDPLILSLLPIFAEWRADRAQALAKIGAPQYEALQEIAFQAVRRARPELTREQFLELPVTLPELIAAFPVIARQTGVFAREDSPGEGQAGTGPPDYRTGTPSSPIPAT